MTTQSETRAGKLRDIAFAIMNTAESSDECADKVLVDRSLVGQLREALAASEPVEAVIDWAKFPYTRAWCDGLAAVLYECDESVAARQIEQIAYFFENPPAPEQPGKGEAVENIAEDSYWAIAEHLGTPDGWSVQEHVWEIADLLRESMFAIGSMGANADTSHPQRGLWERTNAAIKGVQWQ